MPDNKLSFEEALAKLESAVSRLRAGDCTLEESVKLYEKSVEYYKLCEQILKEAKQKIEIYRPDTGETEDFDEH